MFTLDFTRVSLITHYIILGRGFDKSRYDDIFMPLYFLAVVRLFIQDIIIINLTQSKLHCYATIFQKRKKQVFLLKE